MLTQPVLLIRASACRSLPLFISENPSLSLQRSLRLSSSLLVSLSLVSLFFYLPYALSFSFFFNDPATTEIYTLSLHDALPISSASPSSRTTRRTTACAPSDAYAVRSRSRREVSCRARRRARSVRCAGESTRAEHRSEEHTSELHHMSISYAVFCLKKKKKKIIR